MGYGWCQEDSSSLLHTPCPFRSFFTRWPTCRTRPARQERDTYGSSSKARILERSVFSDRMVFVRAVKASGDLQDHELAIYDAWFGWVSGVG